MTIGERSLEKHFEWRGKLRVESNVDLDTRDQLSLAYTPGVAHTCLHIQKHPETSFDLTRRWNTVGGDNRRDGRAWAGGHRSGGEHAGDGRKMYII